MVNDGGPAFPGEQGSTPEGTWNQTWSPGMTLRAYLAAHAPEGLSKLVDDSNGLFTVEAIAAIRVRYADAVIAELSKEPK